jgi:cytochrome P450
VTQTAGDRARITYDPFDSAILADPYAHYRQLRDEAPVHFLEKDGMYTVARYDDARSVLARPNVFSNDGYGPLFDYTYSDPSCEPTGIGRHLFRADARGRMLLFSDPPMHQPLRKLAVSGFSPRTIQDYEPMIHAVSESLITRLVDESSGEGAVDIAHDFALHLPFTVVCCILGVPEADRPEFRRWVDTCTFKLGQPRDAEIAEASEGLCSFFDAVVAARRRSPENDVISRLIVAQAGSDDALSTPEIVAFAILLFLAAGDTSAGLITHWFKLTLCTHPEIDGMVREDPGLIPQAIEELVRYDNSNQAVNRITTEPTEVAGVEIAAGVPVIVLLASANRDERQWGPDAETYRIDRRPTDSLAFGRGIHLCLGAHLARLEARVAVQAFNRYVERAEVAGPILRQDSLFVRQCASIPAILYPTSVRSTR